MAAAIYGQRTRGDLHDYIRVNPSRVLFALLDVAGRIDQNRAILAAVQSTFRRCGPQLLAKDDTNEADAMIEICIQLNRAILTAARGVCACTAFAGCYNESLGTVCYVNAGHTPGLLRDQTGVAELGATGLPLGLFSHSTPDASIIALQPGAALLLVSRGMVETSRKAKEFGLSQVKDLLLLTPEQSAQEICTTVLQRVSEFLSHKPAQNDITAIALARSSVGKSLAAAG
ncbi:MAG TPA: PP2C family protein-serine/threonine phosphatase [Candidatus Dormibacteraeota bacterium]|nr:PP2C family protein-serine/threonine phosphatase [Candidatus Dormibacteraeota bacterium]